MSTMTTGDVDTEKFSDAGTSGLHHRDHPISAAVVCQRTGDNIAKLFYGNKLERSGKPFQPSLILGGRVRSLALEGITDKY